MDIKELRTRYNLSQQELADRTGISRDRIGKWEQGKGNPKVADFTLLRSFFDEIGNKFTEIDVRSRKHGKNNSGQEPPKWNGLPMFDIPVTAGAVSLIRDEPMTEPAFYLQIPSFRDCTFGARVSGDSMYPEIRNGDYVICKEVDKFIFGDIYLVVTDDGQETVKYVHPHEDKEDWVKLVPYNKSVPITPIRKDNIIRMYRVKGVFKGY